MDHSGVQIEKAANSLEVDSNLVQTLKAERMVTYGFIFDEGHDKWHLQNGDGYV